MNPIEILSVKVQNNFVDIKKNFIFEIFYEVKKLVNKNYTLKIIYVISPEDEKKDQELEIFEIPAFKLGKFKMILKTRSPNYENFSIKEIIGITAIILTLAYEKKELLRIGYYINNDCPEDITENLNKNSKNEEIKIIRKILTEEPRITYFFCN